MDKEKAIELLDNLLGMIDDNQGNDYDSAIKKAINCLKVPKHNYDNCMNYTCKSICRKEGYEQGASDMEKAKQIIIDKLQKQIPKWHLCEDELPNESGEYLCYVNYDGNKFYNIEEIDCDGFFKEWNLSGKVKVIAWTELPKFEEVEE